MRLGFFTAIVPDMPLQDVLDFAAAERFACLEVACWPTGKADRRYAGITHIDVADLDEADAARIRGQFGRAGVGISALGYYPNCLSADAEESRRAIEHLGKAIRAARLLGVGVVNTFAGRDPAGSVEANWSRFMEVWPPLVSLAEQAGVRIGIENCPMLFTRDEWPGGKNLATSPAIWRRMFAAIPSPSFGLNYDPSHLVWQMMDPCRPLREFAARLVHVHAKDVRVDRDRLDDVGVLAAPLDFHRPKLPGLGDIDWGRFLSILGDVGYDGPVCIEVEDRAYERSLETRLSALRQAGRHLRDFIP